MPNLEGLGLQNFRTFNKKENFEFAPITLITGINNAGKSSVFKAIQFLVHNFKEDMISDTLDFKDMKHELGNLQRIFNRSAMEVFKNSETSKDQTMYSRLNDFHKKNENDPSELPIFEEDEDLMFAIPIRLGGSREISASLEFRYELKRIISGAQKEPIISHAIKNVAIVYNGEYLHWSNILYYTHNHDDAPTWEMETSINLKKIIQLMLETPLKKIETEITPNEITEDYFTIDLFSRIEKFDGVGLDLPFFKKKVDGYNGFTEKFINGESLFSDYSELKEEEKIKWMAVENKIITAFLKGQHNSQYKILECFKSIIFGIPDRMEGDIVNAELEKEQSDGQKKEYDIFNLPRFQTTPNSKLYKNLLNAIEKDFTEIVQRKMESLKKVYFLPTARGRNREWFIDEQNSEDIQLVREFSKIYLENHVQIKEFVNFWIGKGEIKELDENKRKKQKGFKIGKELSIFRDEEIGLTKIYLVNFDGTKTPLVDLGYGVSQLLPIIMKIAIIAHEQEKEHEYDFNKREGYCERRTIYFSHSTLLIEEPEANLHPSLQSKMAELFIDAASRFNIQFLIETHSEYLIYKFQEYIGKKIVSPSEIKMYYFNHPNDVREGLKDKYVNIVHIEKDGSIDYEQYFGEGFFDEQHNLKLSLLNIQRDRFLDDYKVIKEKLKVSNESLQEFDARIEILNNELLNTASGKNELEEKLKFIQKERKAKETELHNLIKQQEDVIDEYTTKTEYSNYKTQIESIIDINKIDNSKTFQYLATGRYLLKNLDHRADFAPVIIQYGRAVEFQLIKWVDDYINSVSPADKSAWILDESYKDRLNTVFTALGIVVVNSDTILFSFEIDNEIKISFNHLKAYAKNSPVRYIFGNLTQIFELLQCISPEKNAHYNYNSVPLIAGFSNYLKNIWEHYDRAELLFADYRYILNLRNCAGHTYNSSVSSGDIIDKGTAEIYAAKVEAIFRCL